MAETMHGSTYKKCRSFRVLDLFSGTGGFSLGLETTGAFETIAFCEVLPERRRWLSLHWPTVPIYEDVRTLNGRTIEADVVTGGFPCQDVSSANHNGTGLDGERSGLAFELVRIVSECRPCWAVIENSPRLRTRGVDRLLSALEGHGYTCWPLVVGARHVGAPHRRDRAWIIAHLGDDVLRQQSRKNWRSGAALALKPWIDPYSDGEREFELAEHGQVGGGEGFEVVDGEPWGEWNGGPSAHLRVDDGLSTRVARRQIAAFGDAIVPQIAAAIGRAIIAVEHGT